MCIRATLGFVVSHHRNHTHFSLFPYCHENTTFSPPSRYTTMFFALALVLGNWPIDNTKNATHEETKTYSMQVSDLIQKSILMFKLQPSCIKYELQLKFVFKYLDSKVKGLFLASATAAANLSRALIIVIV